MLFPLTCTLITIVLTSYWVTEPFLKKGCCSSFSYNTYMHMHTPYIHTLTYVTVHSTPSKRLLRACGSGTHPFPLYSQDTTHFLSHTVSKVTAQKTQKHVPACWELTVKMDKLVLNHKVELPSYMLFSVKFKCFLHSRYWSRHTKFWDTKDILSTSNIEEMS